MSSVVNKHHPSELWRGYWGIQVLYIGQSLGLFESLKDPQSVETLARTKNMDAAYVGHWCEAALSFQLLKKLEDLYQTPPDFQDWLSLSKGFTQSHLNLNRRMNETLSAVFGGRALPEPTISLRLLLQESLQANYRWLFQEASLLSPKLQGILSKQSRVLEISCGLGFGLSYLRDFYPKLELFGIESDYECAQEAERSTKAVIHIGELPRGKFSKKFELIVSFRSLSASQNPETLLRECAELLSDDGLFLLGSELTNEELHRKDEARMQGERLTYSILTRESLNHTFTQTQLASLLEKTGFRILQQLKAPDWATPAFLCALTS